MGNIQKKLTRKSEGGKRPERGAPRRGRELGPGADKRARPRAPEAAGSASQHPGSGRGAGDPAAAAAPVPAATLGPAGLKSQGNELFKSGQFAEAALKYSAAIAQLEPAGGGSADDLSILYSNRAACYLKEGNCSGCIQDCNRALELHPFSIKPLLRRAMAYETLEQYQKAYVDYKTVLQIDCRIQLANDSINRITRILMDLDGPSWRERLSPIPAVPTSAHLRAWQPVAETPPSQGGDSCSRPQPGSTGGRSLHTLLFKVTLSCVSVFTGKQKDKGVNSGIRPWFKTLFALFLTRVLRNEKMFKTLKEEGNQCVKDKNYKDALSKYSECLKINNKECAIYTNRQVLCNFTALCYLKLCQFEEAKQDCDRALQIDDGSDYQKSLNDLNKVLQLDSSIVEAKMELEEVSEGQEEEPGRTLEELSTDCPASENGDTTSGLPENVEKLPITKPNNAYEFGQVINAISMRNDKQACAHLLTITEPKDLPMLLSNKLEGDTFLLLIQSLKNNLGKDPSLVYQHLLYLSKVERFMMMLTLISKGQKEQIEQLFDDLSDTPNKHFTLEDVQALKR
ncbi:hypothetical protein GH733_008035, partial [Mirounga leonina]